MAFLIKVLFLQTMEALPTLLKDLLSSLHLNNHSTSILWVLLAKCGQGGSFLTPKWLQHYGADFCWHSIHAITLSIAK